MALRRYQHKFLQPLEIDQANIRTNIDATRASVQSLNSSSSNETSTVLKQVSETAVNQFDSVLNSFAGTFTIDSSQGSVFLGDLDFSVTNWNFTNVPTANNRAVTITAIIKGNTTETYGTGATVNGVSVAGGVRWESGVAPTATNNYDVLRFTIARDTGGVVNVFASGFSTGNGSRLTAIQYGNASDYSALLGQIRLGGGQYGNLIQVVNDTNLNIAANNFIYFNTGAATDGSTVGTSVANFGPNGLYFPSGKGIDFSATANSSGTMTSELFDDYEIGTWTPTYTGATTVSTSRAYYIKIGKKVTCYLSCNISGGNATTFTATLPFASDTTTSTGSNNGIEGGGTVMINNPVTPTNANQITAYVWSSSLSFYWTYSTTVTWTQATGAQMGSAFVSQFTYIATT